MKKKVGLILTYNCEKLVQKAIDNIPKNFFHEIICSDDGSTDQTIKILQKNQIPAYQNNHKGYGGNLYSGMKIAFEKYNADYVYELHGDGQYDFKSVFFAEEKFKLDKSDLVLGNRFFKYKEAWKAGMPFPIFIGNIFFSFIASFLIQLKFRDLFPGFRAYSKFFFNTIENKIFTLDYRFSFQIIALAKYKNLKIDNVPAFCNYKQPKTTVPYSHTLSAFLNILMTGIFYRLAKVNLRYKYFSDDS